MALIELSHRITAGMITYPGTPPQGARPAHSALLAAGVPIVEHSPTSARCHRRASDSTPHRP
ncbi:MAG TPA: hypothetical protein VF482_10840 [Trebonia sp.]